MFYLAAKMNMSYLAAYNWSGMRFLLFHTYQENFLSNEKHRLGYKSKVWQDGTILKNTFWTKLLFHKMFLL